jgi:precorrin-6B methylase 2
MSLLNEIKNYELIEKLYQQNALFSEMESLYPQNSKYGYGELTKEGVQQLYKFIKSKIHNEKEINFCDVGSGNGKVCIHLSIISNFNSIYGIEINELRIEYSKTILEKFDSIDNVKLIKSDGTKFNFDNINFVFINDLLFDKDDIENIIKNLKSGTHIISIEKNSLTPLEKVHLSFDFMPVPLPCNYYRKP